MEAGPPTVDVDIEGIDRDRVTGWLAASVPGAEPPFAFELIAGGRSNLTYRVTDRAGRPTPSGGRRSATYSRRPTTCDVSTP